MFTRRSQSAITAKSCHEHGIKLPERPWPPSERHRQGIPRRAYVGTGRLHGILETPSAPAVLVTPCLVKVALVFAKPASHHHQAALRGEDVTRLESHQSELAVSVTTIAAAVAPVVVRDAVVAQADVFGVGVCPCTGAVVAGGAVDAVTNAAICGAVASFLVVSFCSVVVLECLFRLPV